MAALAEAFVAVRADTSKVKGDVEKGVKGAGIEESGKKAGSRWGAVFSAAIGTAAAAGLIRFGKDSVSAFKESEQAQTRLSDAFSKFPKLADTNKAALDNLNASLAQKTRFDDDATASGQAVLAGFKLTGGQITQLTPLLQDYAAKTGKSLPDAAQVLGKAVLGQGRALKGIGLNLKDTGTETGNYTQLVAGLRTQVGGFAEKEGKTAAGSTEILKNQFGELQETVGSKLVPILQKATTTGLQVVNWIQKNSAVMKPLLIGLGILIPAVYALNLALSLNPISLVVIGLAALGAALFVAYKKSETFRNIVNGVFAAVKLYIQGWWFVISAIFNGLSAAFKFVWERGQEFARVLGGVWVGVKKTFQDGARFIWERLRDAFRFMLVGAGKAFGWIPGLGGKLKAANRAFDNFASGVDRSLSGIDDEAIKVALSYSAKGINLSAPSSVGRRASGGSIFGPGTSTSDSVPILASTGEHMLSAREVVGAGGHGAVEAMRSQWRKMATGGRVGLRLLTSLPSAGDIGHVASGVAQRAGGDLYRGMQSMGINPGLAGVLDFVRSQVGKPYVWGGVGPGGYDCSGLVSAAINRAYGRSPYRRLGATGSMPWSSFASGPGAFEVGWFQGSPGHTAATVNGVNIESRGGRGVVMGKAARGARNSLFSRLAHVKGFARGGAVGDLPFDLIDSRGNNFLGKGALAQLGIKSFDTGGPWPTDTLGVNTSGKTETVVTGGGEVELGPKTIAKLADAIARRPNMLDGRLIDANMSRIALRGGYR